MSERYIKTNEIGKSIDERYKEHKKMGKSFREAHRDAKDELPQKGIEKAAQRRLERLGLEISDLEGKKVLDLGSGTSDLERGLSKDDIDIISVDINRESFSKRPEVKRKVQADALELPIKDNSIDVLISMSAAPPYYPSSVEKSMRSLDEIIRVLSNKGTARIEPMDFNFIDIGDFSSKLFSEELDDMSKDERILVYKYAIVSHSDQVVGDFSEDDKKVIARLKRKVREKKSLEYLKKQGYNIDLIKKKVTRPTKKDPDKIVTLDIEYWELKKVVK